MNRTLLAAALIAAAGLSASSADAAIRNLHFAGTCSNGWSDAAKNSGYQTVDEFGFWSGEESWDIYVDQTTTTAAAVASLKANLDSLCTGSNSCYLFTHSQGGAVTSKVFNDYTTSWNITFVATAASNEGGSELSSADWLAELVLGCSYASKVKPSDDRATGWNHNDTNGKAMYQWGGDIGAGHALWWVTSAFLPGDDDGVVAMHSAGSFAQVGSYTSLCSGGTRWTNHTTKGDCAGFNLDHLEMKRKALCWYGGGGTCP